MLLCAAFARIRRLCESPQYLLVILQWKMAVSAILRNTSTRIAQNSSKILGRGMPKCDCGRGCNKSTWRDVQRRTVRAPQRATCDVLRGAGCHGWLFVGPADCSLCSCNHKPFSEFSNVQWTLCTDSETNRGYSCSDYSLLALRVTAAACGSYENNIIWYDIQTNMTWLTRHEANTK